MSKVYSILIKLVLIIIMLIGIIVLTVFMLNKMKITHFNFNSDLNVSKNTKSQQKSIDDSIEKQIEECLAVKDMQESDSSLNDFYTVYFGKYEQNHGNDSIEPIEWIVLSKNGNTAVLMSKYILDSKTFSKENELANWETSDIREWLNNEFYEKTFDDSEKNKIAPMININKTYKDRTFEIIQNDNQTSDKVYLLDIDEIKKYFGIEDFYSSNKKLTTYGTDRSKYLLTIRGDLDWANGNSYWIIRDSMRGSSSSKSVNGKTIYTLKSRQIMYLTATGSLTWGPYNRSKLGIRPVINVKYK